MLTPLEAVAKDQMKKSVADVRSGDTVRVHQKVKEGSKERIQMFEGLVIRTRRLNSHTATITVRRIASGVGVERTFMMHSPLVVKIEVIKRSKVRRKYLSYMRQRSGKSARLESVAFDKDAVNVSEEEPTKAEAVVEESPETTETQEPEAKPEESKPVEEVKAESEEKA